jgi:N-acetylneuraminic acid mutarotase
MDIYDPSSDEWVPGPKLPLALHHAALVEGPAKRLWLIGGYTIEADDSWKPRSEVWSLGEGESKWQAEPPLTAPRGALAATTVGQRIVVAGGSTRGDGRAESVSREVEVLEKRKSWVRAPDMFEPREHFALSTVANRVIAIGGRAGGLDTNLRSVESWRPGENTWRREGALQKERGGFSAAAVGNSVCAAGGEQPNRTISLVECFRDGRWRVVAQLGQARHGLAVVSLAGRLHVIGGGPEPGLTVSGHHEVLDVGD